MFTRNSLEILIKKIIRIQLYTSLNIIAYLFSCGISTSLFVDYVYLLSLNREIKEYCIYIRVQ